MELIYFLIGLVFISLLYPILDEICQFVLTWLAAKKAKQTEKINTTNLKIKRDALAYERENEENIEITGFGSYQKKEEDLDDDI